MEEDGERLSEDEKEIGRKSNLFLERSFLREGRRGRRKKMATRRKKAQERKKLVKEEMKA